jgi:heme/copper-type cytochrome/quinol oxidase subunit 4
MRKWRVGTFSMGLLLVAVGFLLLISEFAGWNGVGVIIRWWPVILIVLGLEILIYLSLSREEQPRVKFDGFSIFIVVFIIVISTGAYAFTGFLKYSYPEYFPPEIRTFQNEIIGD